MSTENIETVNGTYDEDITSFDLTETSDDGVMIASASGSTSGGTSGGDISELNTIGNTNKILTQEEFLKNILYFYTGDTISNTSFNNKVAKIFESGKHLLGTWTGGDTYDAKKCLTSFDVNDNFSATYSDGGYWNDVKSLLTSTATMFIDSNKYDYTTTSPYHFNNGEINKLIPHSDVITPFDRHFLLEMKPISQSVTTDYDGGLLLDISSITGDTSFDGMKYSWSDSGYTFIKNIVMSESNGLPTFGDKIYWRRNSSPTAEHPLSATTLSQNITIKTFNDKYILDDGIVVSVGFENVPNEGDEQYHLEFSSISVVNDSVGLTEIMHNESDSYNVSKYFKFNSLPVEASKLADLEFKLNLSIIRNIDWWSIDLSKLEYKTIAGPMSDSTINILNISDDTICNVLPTNSSETKTVKEYLYGYAGAGAEVGMSFTEMGTNAEAWGKSSYLGDDTEDTYCNYFIHIPRFQTNGLSTSPQLIVKTQKGALLGLVAENNMFPLLTFQGRDITSIMTTQNPYLYLGYGSILNSTNNNIWVYFNDRFNASKISTTGANNVLIPAALMVSGGTSTSTTMSATLTGGGGTIAVRFATKQNFYYYFDFTDLTVNLPNNVTLTFG